ncbi:hypothetical protein MMC07_009704 [Pseudocyphellaria aurata]|nr:hypothetical protein [Pseudocyphellaria aurata]
MTCIAIVITIAWAVSFFFAILFHCGRHFGAWRTAVVELNQYCGESLAIPYGWAISDFLTDVLVVLLPLPQIWKLHMSVSRRLAVITIFLLGTLAIAASITRMVIFIQAIQHLKKEYRITGADELTVTAGLYWSMMESGLGLTAACLTTLYSLFKHKIESITSTKSRLRTNSLSSSRRMVSGPGAAGTVNTTATSIVLEQTRVTGDEDKMAQPGEGQILVQNTLERTEEMV